MTYQLTQEELDAVQDVHNLPTSVITDAYQWFYSDGDTGISAKYKHFVVCAAYVEYLAAKASDTLEIH